MTEERLSELRVITAARICAAQLIWLRARGITTSR
ncbi:MAG: DUF4224 domain-containing protein [Ilumatobacter sp.]